MGEPWLYVATGLFGMFIAGRERAGGFSKFIGYSIATVSILSFAGILN